MRKVFAPTRGFSLVELLISLVITGIVIIPILNIFRAGKKGSIQNTDFFIANNLARERLEEMRLIPYESIAGDFQVFAPIFSDCMDTPLADLSTDMTAFEKLFNDIYCENSRGAHEGPLKEVYDKFRAKYRSHYGREYQDYPKTYGIYRRLTRVEKYSIGENKAMKRVRVTVAHRDGRLLADIVTLMEER